MKRNGKRVVEIPKGEKKLAEIFLGRLGDECKRMTVQLNQKGVMQPVKKPHQALASSIGRRV